VPLDLSGPATDALRFALPFARETGARLDLLHVVVPLTLPAQIPYVPKEWSYDEEQEQSHRNSTE